MSQCEFKLDTETMPRTTTNSGKGGSGITLEALQALTDAGPEYRKRTWIAVLPEVTS